MPPARCDLHVHSRYSTDSGNFALRRARLGESYTDPLRVYRACRERGMRFVTVTDHNTVEGALRIAHLPDTFLSVEVTTRFPEDDLPLHVLVWNLTEEDHRDLQPFRGSVYELQAFLDSRGLPHGLAHPLYRMGPPITVSHVERLLLLFRVWEGRNGGRPVEHNLAACRLAGSVGEATMRQLADRHGLEPRHDGRVGLTGGSDDHGALDIAATWTEAEGETVEEFLGSVARGESLPAGEHGSSEKLAHAMLALFVNAYREGGGELPAPLAAAVSQHLDGEPLDVPDRHAALTSSVTAAASALAAQAREGGLTLADLSELGPRLVRLLLAVGIQLPFLASAHHHAGARRDLETVEAAFFGPSRPARECRALVFTDTFDETNGVAGTMRRLASRRDAEVTVVAPRAGADGYPALVALDSHWSFPLPTSEHIELRFPSLVEVLRLVEDREPDLIQLATPGPVGLSGLVAAALLGIPLVGSYHTELGPYALHLTRDLVVAEAMGMYVDWFYGRCERVLAPTLGVADALVERGVTSRTTVWSRGVDTDHFTPLRRRPSLRETLLDGGDTLLLSVGRVSSEKRLDVLLAGFARARREHGGLRLAIVGDGPLRAALAGAAPDGVTFLGERTGAELADLYASADVFCFPSTTDTFGQVLLEAGASALPVVAAAAGGALELVRAGVTGLLVEPDDPKALAEALCSLARSEELRRLLGAGGRLAALDRTWERSWRELRAAHRDVAQGRSSAGTRLVAA